MPPLHRLAPTVAALVLGAAQAQAQELSGPGRADPEARVELKRQNTSRGTPDESTKTTLRYEHDVDGPVRYLRLDLQFPDAKPTYGGSPLNPRMGDTKLRAGFRALRVDDLYFPSFVELTLPTADPDTLGGGKVVLALGLRMLAPLRLPLADPKPHEARLELELQQTNSIGGDPGRKETNYTKFEASFHDIWRQTYTLKLKFKPSVDWTLGGRSGAVGEVEGGLYFGADWRAWLMLGRRLWGPDGVGGTYDDRVEFGLARSF
jgi:hypothetical protein